MKKAATTETAPVVAQGAGVASSRAVTQPKSGRRARKAQAGARTAKRARKRGAAVAGQAARARTSPAKPAGRAGSKQARVLELLRRSQGATLEEIVQATGWQAHSVRGFLSGTVGKKLGRPVQSSKNEAGARVYQVAP